MDGRAWEAAVHGVAKSWTRLNDFTFTFHFHALEKEMATHSSVLAWRILGTGEPGGLPSMGSHRVEHDWSDLEAAAALLPKLRMPYSRSVKVPTRQKDHTPEAAVAKNICHPSTLLIIPHGLLISIVLSETGFYFWLLKSRINVRNEISFMQLAIFKICGLTKTF